MTTLTLPARSMVPGLMLAHDVADDRGNWVPADPVTITAVHPDGDRLVLSFDNRLRMPFDPDQPVRMVCVPVEHPAWCWDAAECERQRDTDRTIYHSSLYGDVAATDAQNGVAEEVRVGMTPTDDPDGEQGQVELDLLAMKAGTDLDLTPAQARELAALLLEYADQAQPEHDVPARDVRLGDLIETPGGWEPATVLLADEALHEVAFYVGDGECNEVCRPDLDELARIRREVSQ